MGGIPAAGQECRSGNQMSIDSMVSTPEVEQKQKKVSRTDGTDSESAPDRQDRAGEHLIPDRSENSEDDEAGSDREDTMAASSATL